MELVGGPHRHYIGAREESANAPQKELASRTRSYNTTSNETGLSRPQD